MDFIIVLLVFMVGLVAGGAGVIWLVAPLVGREEAHRALAWYLAQRHIQNIQADALARMADLVEAARQAGSAWPIISAFESRAARGSAPDTEPVAEPSPGERR